MNSTNILTGLVLVALVGAVIVIVFNSISEGATNKLNEEFCRTQVLSHAKGLEMSGQQWASEIKCGTTELSVDGGGDGAKKRIAEEMRKCWYSFLEGERNLFRDEYVYCHPCALVEVEDKPVSGLAEYLMDEKIPLGNKTYAEYLTGYTSDEAREVGSLKEQLERVESEDFRNYGDMVPGQDYAVLFVYAKGINNVQKVFKHLTGISESGKESKGWALGAAGAMGTGALLIGASGGTALVVGGIVYGAVEAGTYLYSEESVPEWTAYTTLIEYNEENLKALNCQYEPVEDEQ